jgi:hypothetical protein
VTGARAVARRDAPEAPPVAAPRITRRLRRVMTVPFGVLRAIHSGEVGDSVTWFTVGAAALTVAFAFLLR